MSDASPEPGKSGGLSTTAFVMWIIGVLLMGAGGAVFALGGAVGVILGLVMVIAASTSETSKTPFLMIVLGVIVAAGIAAAGCSMMFRGL